MVRLGHDRSVRMTLQPPFDIGGLDGVQVAANLEFAAAIPLNGL
jgi:hypothetical protein